MRDFLPHDPRYLIAFALIGLFIAMRRGQARKTDALRRAGLLPQTGEKPTDDTIRRLIEADEMIEAIKLHRTIHGTGLKDAKEAVEQIRAELTGKK